MTAAAASPGSELLALWEQLQAVAADELPLLLLAVVHPGHTRTELAAVPADRRDAQLLRWRSARFGDAIEAASRCPACGQRIALGLSAAALLAQEAEPPVPVEEDAAGIGDSMDAVVQALLVRCLAGSLPAPLQSAEGLRPLPPAGPPLALNCPACGHRWSEPLDVAALIKADTEAAATRLLQEVHLLATAYHWSERDILALPPARRRFYLACQTGGAAAPQPAG